MLLRSLFVAVIQRFYVCKIVINMNFVPCLAWVAKGKAKSCPDKVQLSSEELKSLIEETEELQRLNECGEPGEEDDSGEYDSDDNENVEHDSSEDNDGNLKQNVTEDSLVDEESDLEVKDEKEEECVEEDFDSKYGLDTYDDDDGDDRPFMNIKDVALYIDNKEDKYITDYSAVEEDDKEEDDDFIIKGNDNLLVVGHVEEENSVLEIYVYNKEEDTFYVHHDIVLPSFPLTLEWLDFDPSDEKPGSFIAVGDMTPVIKIWDLDIVDIVEPDFCLGKEQKKKKGISEEKKWKYHSDAVLSLSWNKHIRNILASGSADSSIILWDLGEGTVLHKLTYHTNKVQSLQWHPVESSFLLSGCTDGLLKVFDCRAPDAECKSWNVAGEVEKVAWNLLDSMKFLCSTDAGYVHTFDLRKNKGEYSVQVHTEAITGLDISILNPEILVTASMDKTVKVWNIEKMQLVKTHKLKVGSIYTAKFSPDSKMILAVGGNYASNSLKILDLEVKATSDTPSITETKNDVKQNFNELDTTKKEKLKTFKTKGPGDKRSRNHLNYQTPSISGTKNVNRNFNNEDTTKSEQLKTFKTDSPGDKRKRSSLNYDDFRDTIPNPKKNVRQPVQNFQTRDFAHQNRYQPGQSNSSSYNSSDNVKRIHKKYT